MYISRLLIDIGGNPDRPRPGRRWLSNVYHVHQRLSMAFPSKALKESDPDFLQPYDPGHFERTRFLFRIDNQIAENCPRAMILVQSLAAPDWDYAFHNARMFLAAEPEVRQFDPALYENEALRFRIRVNLSKKSKHSREGEQLSKKRGEVDSKGRLKEQSKRVALTWKREENETPDEVIRQWFSEKGKHCGFDLRDCRLMHLGWLTAYKPKMKSMPVDGEDPGRPMRFRTALLEGNLCITELDRFRETLATGIGSAKAFGFGLLSIARVFDD